MKNKIKGIDRVMAKIELFYRVEKFDKDGKKVYDSGKRKSRSFVRQFLQLVNQCAVQAARSIVDVGNTSRSVDVESGWCNASYASYSLDFRINAPAGNSDFGFVVGSLDTAKSPSDYKLASKIVHGLGAGQLDYKVQEFTDPVVSGNNVDWVLKRYFSNASGGVVTVKEVGIIMLRLGYYFLLVRDVLGTPLSLSPDQFMKVEYTFRTTV